MSRLNREMIQALWRLCQDFLTFDNGQTPVDHDSDMIEGTGQ